MQVLLQLQDAELEQAEALLIQGHVGLEVVDFSSPSILAEGWEQKLSDMLPFCRRWAGPITVHGPFLDLSPVSPDPGLRELTLHRYRQALHIAAQLGASHIVFHTQYNPNIREPAYQSGWAAENARFWAALLPEVEESGAIVVLENMWDPRPDHIASLLAKVNSPFLRSCLDVAHANLFSQVPLTEWLEVLGEQLAYVHLSDNRGHWDEHLPLGEGMIDFTSVLKVIAEKELTPLFVLELRRYKDAIRSLRFLENLG